MVQIRRTISIRAGKGVSVGGGHLHHYTWEIGLLPFAVAVSYGTGNALIVDEFALLGRKAFKPLKKGMILVGRPGSSSANRASAGRPLREKLLRKHKPSYSTARCCPAPSCCLTISPTRSAAPVQNLIERPLSVMLSTTSSEADHGPPQCERSAGGRRARCLLIISHAHRTARSRRI